MQFYFALVEPEGTTFEQTFARNDWIVLSFTRRLSENDFASMTLEIKNPGAGLLSGLIWLWFSVRFEPDEDAVPLFFGRIIGIPSSILQEAVTVELIGRPADFVERKAVAADALRVLPGYDEIFIDKQKRDDPDVVLEGYPVDWYIDPVTHEVGTSHVLIGEDGLIELASTDLLWDGFSFDIASELPPRSVAVDASLSWTQLATGSLNLSSYIAANWPNESFASAGTITSFSLGEDDWPKVGTGIGAGWTVKSARLFLLYDREVKHEEGGQNVIVKWTDGSTVQVQTNQSADYVALPPGSIEYPAIETQYSHKVQYGDDGQGGKELSSYSLQQSWTTSVLPLNHLAGVLVASYQAERSCEEHVTFTLAGDVQALVTLPGEDEAARIELRSVNLSEVIGEGEDAELPIGDARRRSYVATARGRESIEHLIALARARLLRGSRAVGITESLTLDAIKQYLTAITLRKNLEPPDPRIPANTLGKITESTFSVAGDSGEISCTVTIGCAIGNGGTVSVSAGTPEYCEDDYIGPDQDWQQYIGRVVLFDTDVGYTPPLFAPNDDGLDFIAGLTVLGSLEQGLSVEKGPAVQRASIINRTSAWFSINGGDDSQEVVGLRATAVNDAVKAVETVATFKLKPVTGDIITDIPVTVTGLKIPKMFDAAAL